MRASRDARTEHQIATIFGEHANVASIVDQHVGTTVSVWDWSVWLDLTADHDRLRSVRVGSECRADLGRDGAFCPLSTANVKYSVRVGGGKGLLRQGCFDRQSDLFATITFEHGWKLVCVTR